MAKKRICKGNIGETFVVRIEDGKKYDQTVVLLDYIGSGDGAQIVFSDPRFPDGHWGKWRCDRFGGKIWRNGTPVTIIR